MKLKIPENFNEIMVTEEFINKWKNKAKKAKYDRVYFTYLALEHLFLKTQIKFKSGLNEDYLNEVKRFFYFWLNSYVLNLKEKEVICSYILSFIVEGQKR